MTIKQFFNRVLILVTVVILAMAAIVTPAYAFVQTDVDLLKETNRCKACDLSGADLSGVDLTGANLSQTNLSNAKLEGAILKNVNLIGANLTGASLDENSLKGALLKCTTLPNGTSSKGCK